MSNTQKCPNCKRLLPAGEDYVRHFLACPAPPVEAPEDAAPLIWPEHPWALNDKDKIFLIHCGIRPE